MSMLMQEARIGRLLKEIQRLSVCKTWRTPGIESRLLGDADWQPFANGGFWGGVDTQDKWREFRLQAVCPEDLGGCRLELQILTGQEGEWDATNPQFQAYVNGRAAQAFDVNHTSLVLSDAPQAGEAWQVDLTGYSGTAAVEVRLDAVLRSVDPEMLSLYYDLLVPWEAAQLLDADDRRRLVGLEILNSAVNLLDLRQPYSAAMKASVAEARTFLKERYYGEFCLKEPEVIADCVGHTHIDVAWQWDIEQSRHKAVRSFSTVLQLMDRYPEYKFMSSQPALYEFVKEDAPEVYERIKARIREGRWQPEGGMWVEADTNLAGGEALVRQFLYGKRFFREEFGLDNRILWLPDVFGYSGALPQIMKKSGIDFFMTTKLSWNEYNRFPYDTFTWRGIDGSEVLTHFSPAREFNEGNHEGLPFFTTYNAQLTSSQMLGGWQRFQQKGMDNHFLVSYGFGDGGGGPTDWMLEEGERLACNIPGIPSVRQTLPRAFYEDLESRVGDHKRLPRWSGELYFEYHRGTYTSIAKQKRYNRKTEIALRQTELLASMAQLKKGQPYPKEALDALWRRFLTLQFHDILPGSSIKKVYDDAEKDFLSIQEQTDGLQQQALRALMVEEEGLTCVNTLSFERDDILWFDGPEGLCALADGTGREYPVQRARGRYCAYVTGIPALGVKHFQFVAGVPSAETLPVTTEAFETPYFAGRFDGKMGIASLVERKSGREVAKPGRSLNTLVAYEDKPHNYDAWDINIYYQEKSWPVDDVTSAEVVENGPVLAVVRVVRRFLSSTIQQDVLFYHDLPRVDFENEVDWQETQVLLKAHFPVDVFYQEATYDIQFGNVRRTTHANTSWDAAHFEVCAHKWADVSEDGFGVSLLNDCKYGHAVNDDSMSLTLIKCATFPNEDADREHHRFTYALMPHMGAWRQAGTVQQGYDLNLPLVAVPGALDWQGSLATCDAPNVLIEAVKRSEDGRGTILRVYECFGRRDKVTLRLGGAPSAVYETDLMEHKSADCATLDDRTVTFTIHPYEIKTFYLAD